MIRRPTVAGYFYPAELAVLRQEVARLVRSGGTPAPRPAQAQAVILPHGSYRHAGAVLGTTLEGVAIPRRCIILGPAHATSVMSWSVMESGAYRTPLGDVPIDASCVEALRHRCPFLSVDRWAQRGEHAVEVLLPFLQRLGPSELTVTPIILGSDDENEFRQMARAVAQVIRMQEEQVLLIASSDFSHYTTQEEAAVSDQMLIDAVCALDSSGLVRLVQQERRAVMCGYGAVACVLEAARQLGASRGRLTAYGTSADGGGDPHSVIGYAGVVIE